MASTQQPTRVFSLTEADRPARLDAVLRARLPGTSRREIGHAIAIGTVTVNGRPGRKGQPVGPGDRIDVGALADHPPVPVALLVPTLYADSTLMAVDKPAGIPAVARRLTGRPSVAGYLLRHAPELAHVGASALEAGLVHRLDTGTSGVLLLARSQPAWRALRSQFRRRAVRKEYLAIVQGSLRISHDLAHDLAHDPGMPGRMVVVTSPPARTPHRREPRVWHALARATPLEIAKTASLVRVELATGVTHQIRTQLAAIGHPVVGDALYGGATVAGLPADRYLLHAAAICVIHPATQKPLVVRSPVPQDFRDALRRFGFKQRPPRTLPAGASTVALRSGRS